MDVVRRKVENQVHFWSLLGPFFVLLSIAVLLFKVSPHWYFPLSALIGIPLCVKWKMKGMAFALSCLFLFAGINFQELELDDRYWHVGLALAMAFSFIVLTLSLEEAQGLVNKVQLESQSRLDNFLLLDEKLKSAELERSCERERAKNEIGTLTQELARIHEDKQIFYKLAQLAKDELVQVRGQHDQLLQDLLYKKQHISQLHERIEEMEITIAGFVNSDSEKQIQILSERIAALEQEKEIFKAKISLAQEEGQIWQREKEQLLQAQSEWQKQCEQASTLELHYLQTVEQSKLEAQESEARLRYVEKEKSSLEFICKELDEKLQNLEKLMKQKEENYKSALSQLQKEIDDEKQQSEAQFKKSLQHFSEQSQQELKSLQEKYHQINEDFFNAKQDLDKTREALKSIRNKENEYQLHCEQLQKELEVCKKNESNLIHTQRQLDAKNETLAHMQSKIEQLSSELNEQKSLYHLSSEQNQKLEALKSELEHALQAAKADSEALLRKMESNQRDQVKEKHSIVSGNNRGIESMYNQLKEQFQEKCSVLDGTRRELFQVHEELLKHQREYEEEHRFNQSPNEKLLHRYAIRLGKQFEQMQENYQKEIDDLTEVIAQLLRQMKK